jgi:non-lysosomal glucosylceramidase
MKTKDGAGQEITKDLSGIDEGCLTDQIIGQWAAHWSGLGDLFNSANRKTALKNIINMSYSKNFGLRNCAWPEDNGGLHPIAPDVWVDQANTCWSGVELSFASFLLYEGLYQEAMDVIKTVDDRYIKCGRYFDHQEFGGHYFRSMGAWGIVNGLIGLTINQGKFGFSPKMSDSNYKLFFSFSGGYANLSSNGNKVTIEILSGEMNISKLDFASKFNTASVLGTSYKNLAKDSKSSFDFKANLKLMAGQKIELS